MKSRRKQVFYNYFEKIAPTYGAYRKRFSYYWKDIAEHINFFISEDDKVLEVGSGIGHTLAAVKAKYKMGIDFSPQMVAQARLTYPDMRFEVMDAECITLDEKFDVIVLSNTIGYFDNVLDVFLELHKVCHAHTRIFISYYNFFWEPALKLAEWLGLKKRAPKQSWLSVHDIENLLYLSDFEAFNISKRILIPFYIPLLSTLFNKYLCKFPIFRELSLNRFVVARPVRAAWADLAERYSTTVVIPARNESGNIEAAIQRLPKFGKWIEIIFVEGNSTDDTWDKILEIQAKYSETHRIVALKQDGKGKGDAVRKGYAVAQGDILMILDADLTVPPEDLPKFYRALADGKGEFINGSRLVYPMEDGAMRHLNTLGNKFFSLAFSWLLSQPIKDTLCGTKVMFRTDYVKLANNRGFFGDFDPFGDYDLLFGAYKLNLKIIDLPIRYRERTYGETNISRFRHGLLLLRMVFFAAFKIKFR
jgi:ubiquinone/menaquinone biosynthesis C-methylase UbiE